MSLIKTILESTSKAEYKDKDIKALVMHDFLCPNDEIYIICSPEQFKNIEKAIKEVRVERSNNNG